MFYSVMECTINFKQHCFYRYRSANALHVCGTAL